MMSGKLKDSSFLMIQIKSILQKRNRFKFKANKNNTQENRAQVGAILRNHLPRIRINIILLKVKINQKAIIICKEIKTF